jgi:hypothetical protein
MNCFLTNLTLCTQYWYRLPLPLHIRKIFLSTEEINPLVRNSFCFWAHGPQLTPACVLTQGHTASACVLPEVTLLRLSFSPGSPLWIWQPDAPCKVEESEFIYEMTQKAERIHRLRAHVLTRFPRTFIVSLLPSITTYGTFINFVILLLQRLCMIVKLKNR